MKFTELKRIFEDKLGIYTLADIARELNVSPQVINNWKSRNIVPYKYIHSIKILIEKDLSGTGDNEQIKTVAKNEENFEEDEFSIEDFIKLIIPYIQLLKKHMIFLIVIPLLTFTFSYLYLRFFVAPVFVSTTQILPLGDQVSKISRAASTFGLQFGGGSPKNLSSISMFPSIIKSRMFAKEMMQEKIIHSKNKESDFLINVILGYQVISSSSPDSLVEISLDESTNFISKFKSMISVEKNKEESSLLNVSISSNDSYLSKNLLDRVISKMQSILISLKLSLAKEKKEFIAGRIVEVEKELASAEDDLKTFREQNRKIIDSPALLLEMDRLSREVAALQQIFITLRSESELVEIEIIERGSRFQILDSPEVPLSQSSPRFLFTSGLFSLISIFAVFLIIIINPIIKENYYLFYLFKEDSN